MHCRLVAVGAGPMPNLERETTSAARALFLVHHNFKHIASLPYLTINVSCISTDFAAFLGNSSLE